MIATRFSRCSPVLIASALLGALALLATVPAANAQTLTDITLFRLDNSNNTISEGANTRGSSFDGGSVSNLYLKSGATFLNSGDGAGVNIAIDLSVPATYTYSFVMDNVNTNTNTPLGINFFFNNSTATPGISARGPQSGGFVANGNLTNAPLFSNTVAGANTLTFFNNGRQITLSNFAFQTTGGPDQVSSFNNAPNGVSDTNGSFTLTVTAGAAAPEPGTVALLGTSLVPLAGLIVRRRKTGRFAE